MRYYFSGLDPRYGSVFDDLPQAGLLFTAASLRTPSTFNLFATCSRQQRKMVLDCGLMQSWLDEDVYLEVLNDVGHSFEWCSQQDVLGSLSLSNGNYNYARDYIPADLARKLLYVLHGNPTDGFTEFQYRTVMTVLTRASPHIGIGGLVPLCRRGQFETIERYLDAICERLGPEVCQWMHLFGIGNERLLSRYRTIFGSADSSTWLCGVRGELLQEDGARKRLARPFDKLYALRHNVEMVLRWVAANEPPSPKRSLNPLTPTDDPYILDIFP